MWRCLRDDTTARMQPPPLERKNVEENVEETVDEGVPAPGKLQTEPARRFAASTDRSAAAICQTWWSACDAKSGEELDGEVCGKVPRRFGSGRARVRAGSKSRAEAQTHASAPPPLLGRV